MVYSVQSGVFQKFFVQPIHPSALNHFPLFGGHPLPVWHVFLKLTLISNGSVFVDDFALAFSQSITVLAMILDPVFESELAIAILNYVGELAFVSTNTLLVVAACISQFVPLP